MKERFYAKNAITLKKPETDEELRGKAYVHWKAWHEAYPGLVSDAYLRTLTLEKCEEMAFRQTDGILIAKDGDSAVGFVGSYDFFNYNVDRDMDQHKVVAGLQYWFYKRCRIQLQYVYKSASLQDQAMPGGAVSKVFTHNANHAIMCQMQVRIK